MNPITYCQAMWSLAAQGELQGIWFWAAVYTLLLCTYSLVRQIQTRAWPFVAGHLTDLAIERFGAADLGTSEQDYSATALYRYSVDEKPFEGTRLSPWIFVTSRNARAVLKAQMASVQFHEDGSVKVFYNPRKPAKSFLIIAGWFGMGVTLAVATLPFIAYYFKFYA